jgi:hypothetical protein
MALDVITKVDEISVGDRVELLDRSFAGELKQIGALVQEVRYILGRQTYVIETDAGVRKVVGASQIRKAA